MPEQKYISLSDNTDHLTHHFAGSKVPGSKFFPEAAAKIIEQADRELWKRFQDAHAAGHEAGRVIFQLEFKEPVGTDALVALARHAGRPMHRITRNPGSHASSVVTVVETETIPATHLVTIIAGPYGATAEWGLYTMFPGREAPPFPNENQSPEEQTKNSEFWQVHGFLATPEEIAAQGH